MADYYWNGRAISRAECQHRIEQGLLACGYSLDDFESAWERHEDDPAARLPTEDGDPKET